YGCAIPNVIFSNDLVSIGSYAFSDTGLTNVFLPASVTNVAPYAFAIASLRGIGVDTNNLAYRSIDGVLFDAAGTTLVLFPIGKSGIFLKPGSYTITNGVTRIADTAFAWCDFSNLVIPSGVTNIGDEAFNDCSRLANLTLPEGLVYIGNAAFEETAISNLVVPSSVTTFGFLGIVPHLQA